MLSSRDILARYLTFFKQHGHKQIPNAPLVLQNDPTTLFTSSGMQPLVPYLLGEEHPDGKRLVNAQNCIRTQDIEEIGDNRHTTFFRMLGNWSLGDYFKKEQLFWFFEFLTSRSKGLGLDPKRLYITVFAGDNQVPKDTESIAIWRELFKQVGIDAKEGDRIRVYGAEKNWWSRSGVPENMPSGEPGGPDSEVFFDFKTPHDPSFGEECHPNCDCGRFMEIGNSVFMQYQKSSYAEATEGQGKKKELFVELPQKNVDFGGGLERLAAAVNDNPDVFTTDLFSPIVHAIEKVSDKSYNDDTNKTAMRIIADHLKAATFLIVDGVTSSNKEQGYVLRRLLRRAAVKMHKLQGKLDPKSFKQISDVIVKVEERIDEKLDYTQHHEMIAHSITDEISRFATSLEKGLKEVEKNIDRINDVAFDIYQSHGFPYEILEEIVKERGKTLDKKQFDEAFRRHQDASRSASAGKFRGGLADHEKKTIMGHTATHLLHQALRDVLGKNVHQTGSNITTERARFDFNYEYKLTDEQIKQVEDMVNDKIKENIPVHYEIIPTDLAHTIGAIGLFMDTYADKSKIYFIGGSSRDPKLSYSIEFCGGPHVNFTGGVKSFKIIKQENLGKNQRRVYAIVGE